MLDHVFWQLQNPHFGRSDYIFLFLLLTYSLIPRITGYKSRSTPIICEVMSPEELNTLYANFDVFNKESVVKKTGHWQYPQQI